MSFIGKIAAVGLVLFLFASFASSVSGQEKKQLSQEQK